LRAALLVVLGAEWHPIDRLALRLDSSAGWQLLSGTITSVSGGFSGAEGRGLRYELAGGLSVDVTNSFGLFARGGLAIDGVWPAHPANMPSAPSSLRTGGFASVGLHFAL
jgi:hypothetical protein